MDYQISIVPVRQKTWVQNGNKNKPSRDNTFDWNKHEKHTAINKPEDIQKAENINKTITQCVIKEYTTKRYFSKSFENQTQLLHFGLGFRSCDKADMLILT